MNLLKIYFLKINLAQILRPIIAVFIGLILGLSLTLFAGENPWRVFLVLMQSGFGSFYDFGMVLSYSAPLILTGLSVAFAYHCGLFNIGAEGQLTMGALGTAVFCALVPLPSFIAPVAAMFIAGMSGGIWGFFAGYLKAKRGAHEVITTIMLNFIAAGIASFVAVYVLKDPNSQNPQTVPILPQYVLHSFPFFQGAPLTSSLFLSIFASLVFYFFLYKTPKGFEIRAVGENINSSYTSGIHVQKIQILSMFISGVFSGLVGVGEVLGRSYSFKLDFSPGYGFTGIAVAFLAKGNPIGIIFSGLLFGLLTKGSGDLEIFSSKITSDLSLILQGMIILIVSSDGLWDLLKFKKKGLSA